MAKVLVVGGGGREHALAWKLAQSPKVDRVYVAPGNAGTRSEPDIENVNVSPDDIDGLSSFAADGRIDLTVVGPEGPLTAGIVDRFESQGLRCFGPRREAAQLEGSKSFTKSFLERHGIPTASYKAFENSEEAKRYVQQVGTPIVIKADGLAAGKGVTVARDKVSAQDAVDDCLSRNRFGEAGRRVVVEEYLEGEEASFICVVSGNTVVPMANSQDHKARDDGDRGPNTGGMGAYSPAPVVDGAMHDRIMDRVINPTVQGLKKDGIDYVGFLYAGLMIDPLGEPRVLEFNCRFGDPETQPVMMRMRSDLFDLCNTALDGGLDQQSVLWDERPALGVVLAAGGYPDQYQKGYVISGIDDVVSPDVKVFHAGTRTEGEQIVTDGGRVLCVTALGESVQDAQQRAYGAVERISWKGVYYRKDIGYRAIRRDSQRP